MKKCQWNVNERECGSPATMMAQRPIGDEERLEHPMAALHEFYICDDHRAAAEEWAPTPLTLTPAGKVAK